MQLLNVKVEIEQFMIVWREGVQLKHLFHFALSQGQKNKQMGEQITSV